jgi:hypothetical protein
MQMKLRAFTAIYIASGLIAQQQLPTSVAIVLFGQALAFYVYSVASIAIAFVYRYAIVCSRFRPTDAQIIGTLIIVFISTLIIPVTMYSSTLPIDLVIDRYNSNRSIIFNVSDHVPIIVFGTDISLKPLAALPRAIALFAFIPAYIIIGGCFARIYIHLHQKRDSLTSTPQRRRMQTRLLYALLVQSVLPAICLLVSTANYVMFMFDNDDDGNDRWSQFISFTTPHYIPIINPMVTICFIPTYRRALIKLLRSGKLHSSPHTIERHQQLSTSYQVIDRVS